jgi:acyl carrier protein
MNKDIKDQVLKGLSDQLGLEPEDINDEDSIYQDLHMQASDISDFMERLQSLNIETGSVNLTEIETVTDLLDALGGETSSD